MADKKYPKSGLPIRQSVELLPVTFRTTTNDKFMSAVVDPLVQPGVLEKTVGYVGRRYGKTYRGSDIYLDTDNTLRSRYQLEPGVVSKNHGTVESFYDYLDFKNQLKFFGNNEERDDLITAQKHYTWDPPVNWDKFVNYREYYWEPSGPPSVTVAGQSASIVSSYKVVLGTISSFIFYPDGFTNNPTITLYRGQTYKFNVDVPGQGFSIRTNYDTGSLLYNPNVNYPAGSIVVFDNKLWRSKVEVIAGDGSSITPESQDWEFVELASNATALDYNKGVTNNGIQNGTVTFTVPYDAPDALFYQSLVNPNRFGRFIIADIESNTKINIEKEILGKQEYTSSNGVTFTNGLVIEFTGQVLPSEYSRDTWLVEGVGKSITLTRFSDLVVPTITTQTPEILFDNEGFDTQPFDDATQYPGSKDYITIARNSQDNNPWSRYNRWFHRSVLEYAYRFRGQDFNADESARAKRPIIEFHPNIQLFNHGAVAKVSVDYIDNFTDDIFSKIEGSTSYNIEGEFLFDGARILVTGDKDGLVNNRIYQVQFINHNNRKQIHLATPSDSESFRDECVLIKRGKKPSEGGNQGLMYHYNGDVWKLSQRKTAVQQPPLFDAFDSSGVSFSDSEKYPVSSFIGTKILSYRIGNGTVDKELGFSLSYLNIGNVGDIQFNWDWDTEHFQYSPDQTSVVETISKGFYKVNPGDQYKNGWIDLDKSYVQPIIDSVLISEETKSITLNTVAWDQTDNTTVINFYLNGERILDTYSRQKNIFTFERTFNKNDVVSVKIITDVPPDQGYYEIPVGLEKNPLNADLDTFTLGEAVDHVRSGLEFDSRFDGKFPGISNVRDLDQYQKNSKRFLKHAGLVPLAVSLLCDKDNNLVKSIQYVRKSYTDFKNNFLNKATELPFNDNPIDFVDEIISDLTKIKNSDSPFADSDMIGCGAFTSINYTVEDDGIRTFALSEKFNLKELSRRAVYVYINQQQLLNSRDYEFSDTFGFVTIKKNVNVGDEIEIREYVSTSFCHIPPTPTSMGLYKKYTPSKFIDDTYLEPKEVIQGHDGSITFAFGDFRDDILLELELRIYNNIKNEYNPDLFDIDQMFKGYYENGIYSKQQIDRIVSQEFLKWIQNTNINYTINQYFRENETFTYTYSNMTDPTGTQNLPGFWRGVYQWFYDTDRPHRCPWEMLGFSEQPTWWETVYGPAPYTSNNLILWEDLQAGIIRQGSRAGQYDRYKRPTLLSHIPVDGNGNLLSPLDSGLAGNFTLINNRGSFILGDIAPVEYAWRSSSEWPFAVMVAMSLLRPFDFITSTFDVSKIKLNRLNQPVNKHSEKFVKVSDINLPNQLSELSVGLTKYLVNYLKFKGLSVDDVESKLLNLDVNLSTRLSGFVDKDQQKYLLDSKNPNSPTSSIFVPPENYDIIFNISAPILNVAYSGVIIEKTEGGWVLTGYDDIQPYFNYYEAIPNQKDPLITVGGVSETFVDWTADKNINNGQIVRYQNQFYRSLKTHRTSQEFEENLWKKLPKLPSVGGVEAFRRRNFNTTVLRQLSYGTLFPTIQKVVDFFLGYETYLKSIGFVFDRYDPENQVAQDWTSSAKEFMFWTKHNWAVGSLITISPSAEKIDITIPVGVADNILNGFYDYQILKGDGKPLTPDKINVNRSFQNIKVETVNTTDGIYFIKIYYVLKEHVTIFDDRTVFNDVIYDKRTGYRQERIKSRGFRTVDWDGDYTSPGFLFDNVNIEVWQPFKDYKLGDIVAYRSYNWTSLKNQLGSEEFDETTWSKLDTKPEKRLVSNFDYKINQFDGYYDVMTDGIDETQQSLARHAIGYQTREYLQNLSEDSVTQFRLYQGFIREKGTSNAITKVFDKLSRSNGPSISLKEEWAFRVGRLGGIDQLKELEVSVDKDKFLINPQPLLISNSIDTKVLDQYYRLTAADFTIAPLPFTTSINPLSLEAEPVKTAGYVNTNQINFVVKTRDDILNLNIAEFLENDHLWVTFDNNSWTVLRYNVSPLLVVKGVEKDENTVIVSLNRRHSISVGDIVGIKDIVNLTGFFKVVSTDVTTITVEVPDGTADPEFDESTIINLSLFTVARFASFNDLDQRTVALLQNNSKLWIDQNNQDLWEVVEKKKQYSSKSIDEYGISDPLGTGSKVLYNDKQKQIIASIPGSGFIMVYLETSSGLALKQIIPPPAGFESVLMGSFGSSMALSPDSRWLIVGSPNAAPRTNYRGEYDPLVSYNVDDIVLSSGKLYRTIADTSGDGSTYELYNVDNFEPAVKIPAERLGRTAGRPNQGLVSIYEFADQQWKIRESIVSPRPALGEKFGFDIAVGQEGTSYTMAISAIGSISDRGRVYLYKYVPREVTVVTFDGNTAIDTNTNIIAFDSIHDFYNGQAVTYFNGTPEGLLKSTADQPPPPVENTSFYIIRIDERRIQLASAPEDVTALRPVNLLNFGIDDSSSHTLVKESRRTGWQHIENANYRGIYVNSPLAFYPAGSVVWHNGRLWKALFDIYGDGSTITTDSVDWLAIDPVSTQSSLPTNASLEDDGSTLALGLLSGNQIAELTKEGDKFGYSISMSSDGSILAVGAPDSDGQYFSNYRGIWRPDIEYVEGDVVKYQDNSLGYDDSRYTYFKLTDRRLVNAADIVENYTYVIETIGTTDWNDVAGTTGITYYVGDTIIASSTSFSGTGRAYETTDSTVRSFNEAPDTGFPWENVGDSTSEAFGKVFVYQRSVYGTYELKQTINAASMAEINDIDSTSSFNSGDQFGYALDLDRTGSLLVVTSPKADINFQDQGSAYVFKTQSISNLQFRLKQKLESFEVYPNEYFGQSVVISPDTSKIIIGAKNTPYSNIEKFDVTRGTTFDQGRTTFSSRKGYSGAAYVFENKDDIYFLAEKLGENLSPYESFGYSIDCHNSLVLVGSPDYIAPAPHGVQLAYEGPKTGTVRLFKKDPSVSSYNTLAVQTPVVDISMIKSIALYDTVKNIKIQDLDYIDLAKLKILNVAEQEIKFKTMYDPAIYSQGTEDQVVDPTIAWASKHVGEVWWNLSTLKTKYYEQGDISYKLGNWNSLAEGASIDVYEWVETPLLPSEWSALADSNEGIAEGISGQPLYPNDDVYSKKELFSTSTGLPTQTLYYYWVKNKSIIPDNNPSRRISVLEVASLISNPGASGTAFLALIGTDQMLAYNFDSVLSSDSAVINIQYLKEKKQLNVIHNEYQLLTEGSADSLPNNKIETKWLDSLFGADQAGNRIPDPAIPAKQKYGLEFRPRQSMFVNRFPILQTTIENINSVLRKQPFADTIDLKYLNLLDEPPSELLNLYDQVVDTYSDLLQIGTIRLSQATAKGNIINGEIDTIDVINKGFGYKRPPSISIDGDGSGARAEAILDNQGRVSSVKIIATGKKYSSVSVTIRPFSVLVRNDSTLSNKWSIYSWDEQRKSFFRSQSQAFDTTRYWSRVDWWKEGYGITTRIVREILDISQESSLSVDIGDLIRIKEYAEGGWAVFEKINNTSQEFLDRYSLVGRQNGTIQLSSQLYNISQSGVGFNVQTFDSVGYDLENVKELRNIFKAVKEDIFIGDYAVEWNNLFFVGIRYAFQEQQYIDWAFKTSFLNATHNVGDLEQKLNYKNDSLDSFQKYIDEVKPYRTTVREYVSRYNSIDTSRSAVSDFDLPATYSSVDGKIIPITPNRSEITSYPWKWWADNNSYSVVSIEIFNSGAGYIEPPRVVITGDGADATAIAYISNGRVSGIKVTNPGHGYTRAPQVSLVGGNATNPDVAKAVAFIGDTKARTFDLTVKFDRISKTREFNRFDHNQEFRATGLTAVFDLDYAPTRDKSKITILKNDQLVLKNEYSVHLYRTEVNGYSQLKGKIIFNTTPLGPDPSIGRSADVIRINYEKNDELLPAVDRIEKFYDPNSGMKGKELSQLMTGIDFGGVQIQGTTFEVTGGWDALPWFTDNWDSVEANSDYYFVVDATGDGSTTTVTLPYVPAAGQQITIYLKRAGVELLRDKNKIQTTGPDNAPVISYEALPPEIRTVRIDDPNYTDNWDSSEPTNPYAQMPTFVGNGVTNIVEIGQYLQTLPGDTLIFRPIESDGSVTITDPNLVDTNISGGSLSALGSSGSRIAPNTIDGLFSIATGKTVDEIVIDGEKFISPDQVPAPEENVPGQVLDSLSMRVFTSAISGVAPIQSRTIISDGTTKIYDIGLTILETSSVLVYVDSIKQEYQALDSTISYDVNFNTNRIEFVNAPEIGAIVEIIAIGIGGVSLLDYKQFDGDGNTKLFLTSANYSETTSIFVTVDGIYQDVGFANSSDLLVDTPNKTLVQFSIEPADNSKINVICLGATSQTDSTSLPIVRVNNQTFYYDGSTNKFELNNFVNLETQSTLPSMIVEVNGTVLRGVDTNYYTITSEYLATEILTFNPDGSALSSRQVYRLPIGLDPNEPAGSILSSNIRVYVNGDLKTFVLDYVYDGNTKIISFDADRLTDGDIVRIENDLRAEYALEGNDIIIDSQIVNTFENNDDSTFKDIVAVTWFSEYPSMKILSDEFVGGKVQYNLAYSPLNISYVWVYKNGQRLRADKDFYVIIAQGILYLKDQTTDQDLIKVILFGTEVYTLPSAFEIHKDMLNVYHFKRYVLGDVKLATDLNYYDLSLTVNDATNLATPDKNRNVPGVVYINGEKIEYLEKTGNVLSQLRRGSAGTSIPAVHRVGSSVVDQGPTETIPYFEDQEREDFISDGSTLLIGPLSYIPAKSSRTWIEANVKTIASGYGPCDQIEVFVGGRRLRKDPITEFDQNLARDVVKEAEFSVDGTSNYIMLTNLPANSAGMRITVIRKLGKLWYEKGETTASKGVTLLRNSTPIASFIAAKTTSLPE